MKKLFFSALWLLICVCPAAAQFKVFQYIAQPGTPANLAPYAVRYILDYGPALYGNNTCTPNQGNIQQYANKGLSSPGVPVSLDMELNQGWPAYTSQAFTDSLNNYIQAIQIFKAVNTTSPVGFYSVPPKQVYNNFSSVDASFAPFSQAMTPLANAVDYYSPDFYNYGSNDTVKWRKAVDTTLAVIRQYYNTSKPIYPYISPNPSAAGLIDSAVWLYDLNYLYTRTQGILLWSNGGGPAWDNNAPWWRCTKKFLVEKGLVPPLVFDNFGVTTVGSNQLTLQWTTSADTVSQYFILQRSTDSINFTNISGQIYRTAYAYNLNQYQFTDSTVTLVNNHTIYYRLAITDAGAHTSYSAIAPYTKHVYRSAGTADMSNATNWQVNTGSAWIAAKTAPATSLGAGDSVFIRAVDTFNVATAWTYIPPGSAIIDSGITGNSFAPYISSAASFVFTGTSAQTAPGSASIKSSTWGNVVVNNIAGVTITQGTDNLLHVSSLSLQSGTFTVNADGGKAAGLYIDGPLSGAGGSLAVTCTGVNQGVILGGTTAQNIPSGSFLNNSVPALSINNNQGTAYGGALTVMNSTHLMRPAAFSVGGNYTLDSLIIDTLGSFTPVVVAGTATVAGALVIKSFASAPSPGQQFIIIGANGLAGSFTSLVLPGGYNGALSVSGNNLVLTLSSAGIVSGAVYKITSALNNSSDLDLAGNSTANYTKVQLFQDSTALSQQWKAVSTGNGYFKFRNMMDTTKCLDVYAAGNTNGTQVDLYTDNNTAAQQWLPVNVAGNYFTLSPTCAPGKVLDDSAALTTNGAKIQLYTPNGSAGQQWLFRMMNAPALYDSLSPIADAFVKNSTPATNYGYNSYLALSSGFYETYLKFDISSITAPVTSAKLRLFNQNSVATTWQLFKVNAGSNGWAESSINWNNKPAADTLLASFTASPADTGYVYWDITAKLDSLLSSAGGMISFKLVSTAGTYNAFSSRENTIVANRPRLMLNRTSPLVTDTAADVADAFVKSTYTTTNFGYNSYMAAYNGYYNSYVKFDLRSIKGKVQDARLRLYSLNGATTQWQLYKVDNNSWTEGGINWSNQPGGSTLLGTIAAPASPGFVYWNLYPALRQTGPDSTLSLEIVATAATYTAFSTRQGTASQVPVILVTEAPAAQGIQRLAVNNRRNSSSFVPEKILALQEKTGSLPAVAFLKVYPNPTSSKCIIRCSQQMHSIVIYDGQGRIMQAVSGLHATNYEINLQAYAPGLYYCRIDNQQTLKLMKIN